MQVTIQMRLTEPEAHYLNAITASAKRRDALALCLEAGIKEYLDYTPEQRKALRDSMYPYPAADARSRRLQIPKELQVQVKQLAGPGHYSAFRHAMFLLGYNLLGAPAPRYPRGFVYYLPQELWDKQPRGYKNLLNRAIGLHLHHETLYLPPESLLTIRTHPDAVGKWIPNPDNLIPFLNDNPRDLAQTALIRYVMERQ